MDMDNHGGHTRIYILLVFVHLLQGVTYVKCASVVGEDQTGLLGDNPLTLTCAFTLDEGESPWSLVIKKRTTTGGFGDLAEFSIPANQSFYFDTNIQDRTNLILLGDSANIRYNSLQCGDENTYLCVFSYTKNSVRENTDDTMNLVVEATPLPSVTISSGYNPNSKIFVEGEELEMRCQGDVGLPAGNFMWFTHPDENGAGVDVTSKSIQGTPTNVGIGPRYCAFRRESTLKLNLTRSDNKLVIRCVLNQTTLGSPPTQNDQCQDNTCKQTGNIEVQYPIREEDMAISSNPKRNEYVVGSDVTMTCTVDGNPAPYFRWEKTEDDSVSPEGENSWTLTNLQLGQGGTYRCFANNTVNGVTFNAAKQIYINVVETTTSSTTSPATLGKTEPVVTSVGGQDASLGTGIAIGVGLMLVLIIVCLIIIFIFRKNVAACLSGQNVHDEATSTSPPISFHTTSDPEQRASVNPQTDNLYEEPTTRNEYSDLQPETRTVHMPSTYDRIRHYQNI